jgi:uncharacterized phage protein (TIGR02218 family)
VKTLTPALADHLAGGATTLALCWRLARRDGEVLGFTEHDLDLAFDGVTYRAASGFTAGEITQSLGLAVDDLTAAGALAAATLNEDDLARGLYDDAEVTIHLVNWADVSERLVVAAGQVGEVKRGRLAFEAELRSLAHRLAQRTGRTYQYYCDADLGDARCGIDLDTPERTGAGTVQAVSGLALTVLDLEGFAAGWFAGGRLTFTSGANSGHVFEVRRHEAGAQVRLELWERPAAGVAVGDAFDVTAGCDKAFPTCRAKFDNVANFRGFPHIPGNDVVQSYPNRGEARLDGGSLFK